MTLSVAVPSRCLRGVTERGVTERGRPAVAVRSFDWWERSHDR